MLAWLWVTISVIDGSIDEMRPSRADEEKREKSESGSSDGHVSQSSV